MKPTPEIEAAGLVAYEQAGAFERLRTWRLPLSYIILLFFPILTGESMWRHGHIAMAQFNFVIAFVFLIAEWFHWRLLVKRYLKNLKLLGELEREYGNQLSWVQVENHFAALEKLEQELAEEKRQAKE